MINVLHVNNTDLPGRRFNGFDLIEQLVPYGVACKQAVIDKYSDSQDVIEILGPTDRELHSTIAKVEHKRSIRSLLYPWGRQLARMTEFQEADVIHYHLIHNQVLSILDLPELFNSKPSVWTIHDPWVTTGHCVYPFDCDGWLSGCTECPHLDYTFEILQDTASEMWKLKRALLEQADVRLIVASESMYSTLRESPITRSQKHVALIPFGVNLDDYHQDDEQLRSRHSLNIPANDFVIAFRSTPSPAKGLSFIVDALRQLQPKQPVTLLTVDQVGLLDSLKGEFNIIELGWRNDKEAIAKFYSACDLFLMPSTTEAFGLMAVEAMASSRTVISFDGTSLPAVTNAPQCGAVVPMGDARALSQKITHFMDNPDELMRRGIASRKYAELTYGLDTYLSALANTYSELASKQC